MALLYWAFHLTLIAPGDIAMVPFPELPLNCL